MARNFVAASSQWLTISSALVSTPPFTLAAWIRPTSAILIDGNYHSVLTISDNSTKYFALYTNPSGGVSAYVNNGAGGTGESAVGSLTGGTWAHAAAVFASTTSRTGYKDGAAGTANTTSLSLSGLTRTQIATLWTGTNNFSGDIAEATIWSAALDAAELAALAAAVSPLLVRPTALVEYWPIIGQYSPEIALVGRNELTLNNTPTAAAHCRIFYAYTPAFIAKAGTLYHITGVTKNASGSALASCTVKLFRASDDLLIASTTSDGSGSYSFNVGNNTTQYYLVAYKAGSPDVAGTTKNTLVGA